MDLSRVSPSQSQHEFLFFRIVFYIFATHLGRQMATQFCGAKRRVTKADLTRINRPSSQFIHSMPPSCYASASVQAIRNSVDP